MFSKHQFIHQRNHFAKVLHWALAFSVLAVLLIFENGDALHRYVGYFSLSVVVLRFTGKIFENVVKPVSDCPLLALCVHYLIWGLVVSLGVTGWMMSLDLYWGEEWLEKLHMTLSYSLVAFIGTHLLGLLIDALRHKRPTWMLMVTGLGKKTK